MIKMVVTDIDGTILNAKAECSDSVRKTINKLTLNGVKVVLATGRMFRATYPVAKDLNITTPIISYQGGLIKEYLGEQKVLYSSYTDSEHAKQVIKYFRKNNIHINVYVNDSLFVENDDDYIKQYIRNRNIVYTLVDDLTQIDMNGLHKVLGIDGDIFKVERAVKELKERFNDELYIIRSTPTFCEVSNPKASKAEAMKFLMKYWDIKKEEVLAIGDQDNDIDMVETAGIGVAMGNGTEKLMEKADFITKPVNDDGFTYAMEKFCNV